MEKDKLNLLNQIYGDAIADESSDFLEFVYSQVCPQEVNIIDVADSPSSYLVHSPDGFVPVKDIISKGVEDILEITFTDGTVIHTSPFHCFETTAGGWVASINMVPGHELVSEEGHRTVLGISDMHLRDLVFDLVIDHENHRYYTQGVSSHNSGAGKSLFLQNLAVNWATAGLNVVYLSLELSEKLCAMRIDAMHTGYDTREVMRNIDDVHMKLLQSHRKNKGSMRIKQMPNGCTANDIRAFIKEYEIHTGVKVDAILVDYLDLMMPMSKKISAENLFVKDKYVAEELRNLAVELDILAMTASQLNRGSYETADYDASTIAGGLSKINTADNVFGIFTSAAMKESGRYQIQFMKTRSSSGVGSKIDLAFDVKSLRITDLEDGAVDTNTAVTKSIYDQLKKKSVVSAGSTDSTPTPPKQEKKVDPLEGAAALRNFINRRK